MMWGYQISGARREGNELVVNVRASRLRSLVVVAQAVREAARGRSLRDRSLLFAALALFVGKIALRGLAAIAGIITVIALPALALTGCAAGQTPVLSPIAPRVVHDALYGTCVEVGGKLTVGELAIAQLSRTCVLLDGGAAALDAGLDLDEPLPTDVPDKTDAGVRDE